MNELNKLYKAMLVSWGCVIKDDGRVFYLAGGEEHPITVDEMALHLPLSEVLDGNTIDKVFFHPACENITSKETEVFKLIRKMTVMNLLTTFRQYPIVLFGLCNKEKKGWKQHTLDLLEPIKAAKRATRDELNKLFERMEVEIGEDGLDNRFIHFKVTKGGGRNKTTGERVYYKTKPSFPFYSEIIKRLARSEGSPDNTMVELNNFSVSRGALKLAAHLFQQLIPGVNNPDDLEFESVTPIAARLISYLGCYSEVVGQLNRIQNTFRADFDKAGVFGINDDWTEYLEDLPEIYRQVPVMDYNSHNTADESLTAQSSANVGGMLNVNSSQFNNVQTQQPQQQPQQQQQQTNGEYDLTVPTIQPGDRFVRTEIDYLNTRVLHHAINTMTNNPVVYHCTRYGNLLQRLESQFTGMNPMQMQMMGGMMNPQMMGNFNQHQGVPMQMMANGMMMPMNQFQPPSATASAVSMDPNMVTTNHPSW